MHPISAARFEALAAYCRFGPAMHTVEELAWYESDDGRMLGVVVRELVDGEFQAVFLAPDLVERFRWIHGTNFVDTPEVATADLLAQAPALLARLDGQRAQGDEPRRAIDFFAPRVPASRLDPSFVQLRDGEGFSPARELIGKMMRWHQDIDGNYVEQFQSAAFDARLLELYVYALLVENGFEVTHEGAAPDFLANDGNGELALEVTSVNPSLDAQGQRVPPPPVNTPEEMTTYLKQYMPIKFGGPLTAKLRKRYWTQRHVAGKPLLFVIQDFHAPASMIRARTGLSIYLYGIDHDWHHDDQGHLVITPRRVSEHRWGDKVIPSGFFDLPEAENVSAVLFNNSATLPKFNRMGFVAGFGSRRVQMVRSGFALDPDPDAAAPTRFVQEVDDTYSETWSEGLDVFHNPHALQRQDPRHFPTAVHHFLEPDGQMRSLRLTGGFHPLASTTGIMVPDNEAG